MAETEKLEECSDQVKRKRSPSPTIGESAADTFKKSVQPASVSSSITAETGGVVVSPNLAGNIIHGPVSIQFFSGSAGATSAQKEDVRSSVSCDAKTDDVIIKSISDRTKRRLKSTEYLFEGTEVRRKEKLCEVYTELCITDGVSDEVKTQHELRQMEVQFQRERFAQAAINYNDIFKLSAEPGEHIRTVMTKGIAGIGKSVTVQKFILDWREKRANRDVDFILMLPFRELNLFIDDQYSLHGLLCEFHPELRNIPNVELFDKAKIILIFDGLDESKFCLNFKGKGSLSSITDTSSVCMLIVNLLKENLLPSASIWITSRPAAAHQIPPEYIDRWTEIQGFNDEQKEQYFRNKIKDGPEADRLMKQIKASRSLYIMSSIPVFCWILATVILRTGTKGKQAIPQTLTELFAHFLLIQLTRTEQKNEDPDDKDVRQVLNSNKDVILKLAELAYRELEKDNALFSEENLKDCRIDIQDLEKSGMCTEVFVSETVILQKKVFSFVHLSIQEFLAALFVFYSFSTGNLEVLKSFAMEGQQLHDLLESAVRKSLQSQNGHLDLFLRFLLGLSLESNQKLLKGLLMHTQENSGSIKRTVQYIKNTINRHNQSTERCMNLLLCLLELKDRSLHEEVQRYVESGELLSPAICSTLAYIRLVSEDTQEMFDLTKYNTTDKGRMRLVIAVRSCRKARLVHCGLTKDSCETISSALKLEGSQLMEVDLSYNAVGDSGVSMLLEGLTDRNSRLHTLRMASCDLTGSTCRSLTSALQLAESHLRELDLTNNDLTDSGVAELYSALCHQDCKLKTLRLAQCNLTGDSCVKLASALRSAHSTILELDLSNNDLGDSGVEGLCAALGDLNCKLEMLKLSGCLVTEKGCGFLSSALRQCPSRLRELDLSYNYPGDTGCLKDKECHLEKLNVDHNDGCWLKPGLQKYAWELTLDVNTVHPEVQLSDGNRTLTHVDEEQPYLDHPERFDHCPQVLCTEGLRGRHYWEAEWSGGEAVIGVAYRSIRRKMWGADCKIGLDDKSCGLWCEGGRYSMRHNKNKTIIPPPASSSSSSSNPTHSKRVGVYLDWPAGTLSFFSVSSGRLVHMHTFYSTFTDPLYPGFWVHVDSSVSLCQVT
ncbi:NACHT, LRR and PYD domains-containing protein 12-like [Alosa sapidissima]|uniref:NACHT, LRR and PYD domains-containing protein 12-like n=1 Tax=Alosa sapidissima TaxID=34773 RepID=UPI001C090864|nr:NACHT, LRR and PYD domains-containing protein 12-like [Alosa sapidissima]XP_041960933.1 NACHT, LRR and PYD domains-containing protein 12-like [Alosa sapidissima]XP_041960934.1 NACHT, LRR and PYD domains-containing protein 12-like [Alosa sapidissima]